LQNKYFGKKITKTVVEISKKLLADALLQAKNRRLEKATKKTLKLLAKKILRQDVSAYSK
jgi:hypothetical protein